MHFYKSIACSIRFHPMDLISLYQPSGIIHFGAHHALNRRQHNSETTALESLHWTSQLNSTIDVMAEEYFSDLFQHYPFRFPLYKYIAISWNWELSSRYKQCHFSHYQPRSRFDDCQRLVQQCQSKWQMERGNGKWERWRFILENHLHLILRCTLSGFLSAKWRIANDRLLNCNCDSEVNPLFSNSQRFLSRLIAYYSRALGLQSCFLNVLINSNFLSIINEFIVRIANSCNR